MSPAIHEVSAESKVKFQPLLALFIHHLHNHYDLQGDTVTWLEGKNKSRPKPNVMMAFSYAYTSNVATFL